MVERLIDELKKKPRYMITGFNLCLNEKLIANSSPNTVKEILSVCKHPRPLCKNPAILKHEEILSELLSDPTTRSSCIHGLIENPENSHLPDYAVSKIIEEGKREDECLLTNILMPYNWYSSEYSFNEDFLNNNPEIIEALDEALSKDYYNCDMFRKDFRDMCSLFVLGESEKQNPNPNMVKLERLCRKYM